MQQECEERTARQTWEGEEVVNDGPGGSWSAAQSYPSRRQSAAAAAAAAAAAQKAASERRQPCPGVLCGWLRARVRRRGAEKQQRAGHVHQSRTAARPPQPPSSASTGQHHSMSRRIDDGGASQAARGPRGGRRRRPRPSTVRRGGSHAITIAHGLEPAAFTGHSASSIHRPQRQRHQQHRTVRNDARVQRRVLPRALWPSEHCCHCDPPPGGKWRSPQEPMPTPRSLGGLRAPDRWPTGLLDGGHGLAPGGAGRMQRHRCGAEPSIRCSGLRREPPASCTAASLPRVAAVGCRCMCVALPRAAPPEDPLVVLKVCSKGFAAWLDSSRAYSINCAKCMGKEKFSKLAYA